MEDGFKFHLMFQIIKFPQNYTSLEISCEKLNMHI